VLGDPELIVTEAEPVFPLASVAVIVAVSGTVSLALIVKVPALRVLELSPKTPSPLGVTTK